MAERKKNSWDDKNLDELLAFLGDSKSQPKKYSQMDLEELMTIVAQPTLSVKDRQLVTAFAFVAMIEQSCEREAATLDPRKKPTHDTIGEMLGLQLMQLALLFIRKLLVNEEYIRTIVD